MLDIEKRVKELESRIAKIESFLRKTVIHKSDALAHQKDHTTARKPVREKTQYIKTPVGRSSSTARAARIETGTKPEVDKAIVITNILGWSGAAALVLAAAYLIRLAIESGWLTPARQIGFAVLGSLILIITGLGLRNSNRQYASLLPAGGVVILFLSVYGANIYYRLINEPTALSAVILVCFISLWLCRVFKKEFYAMFAVIGSYSVPLFLPSLTNNITDLVIYFTTWSIIFCVYSIWIEKRRIYLLALYLALISFDFIWRSTASGQWIAALVFQTLQLIIFAGCAAFFSVKRDLPMDREATLSHMPAILIFYFLQYSLLNKHIPAFAPWIAVTSAAIVALFYWIARTYFRHSLEGGRLLLSTYCALVLFHAGYLQSVPSNLAPWVALLLIPLVAAYGFLRRNQAVVGWPMWIAVGLIFSINFLRIVLNSDLESVPWSGLLVILYSVESYLGYYFVHRLHGKEMPASLLIYAGHLSLMSGAVHLFDSRFIVSLAWGALALACLIISLSNRHKILGQSSLFVFAASAVKLLLYDLSEAAPLVRISCLIVLGVTFYLGGWLYRKVDAMRL